MPPEWPLAEVIPSQVYLDSLNTYESLFPNIREIHEGIVWTLERDPLCGTEVPKMLNHRVLKTYPASSQTEFYVLFKYSAAFHRVHLLSISSTGIIM